MQIYKISWPKRNENVCSGRWQQTVHVICKWAEFRVESQVRDTLELIPDHDVANLHAMALSFLSASGIYLTLPDRQTDRQTGRQSDRQMVSLLVVWFLSLARHVTRIEKLLPVSSGSLWGSENLGVSGSRVSGRVWHFTWNYFAYTCIKLITRLMFSHATNGLRDWASV